MLRSAVSFNYRILRGKCHVLFVVLKRNWCAVKLASFPRGVTALNARPRRSSRSPGLSPKTRGGQQMDVFFWRHRCRRAESPLPVWINQQQERETVREGWVPAYFKIQNYMSERTDFKTDFMIKVGVREKLAHNKTISYFIPQNFALLRKRALKWIGSHSLCNYSSGRAGYTVASQPQMLTPADTFAILAKWTRLAEANVEV